MKRLIAVLLIALLCLTACGEPSSHTQIDLPANTFMAKITAVYDQSIMVDVLDNTASFGKASVSLKNIDDDTRQQLKVGASVQIAFSGVVLETYPVQLPDVYRITVAEQTEHTIREYDFSNDDFVHTNWVNWPDDNGEKMWEIANKHPYLSLSSRKHLPVVVVRSSQELQDFIAFCDGYLALDATYDEAGKFSETAKKFDDAYFEQKALCIILVTSGSGSDRFYIEDVSGFDDELHFSVGCNSPEVGTCDMAGWLLTVEFSKSDLQHYRYFIAC